VLNKRGRGGKVLSGAHEKHKDKGDAQHKDDGKHGVPSQHDGDHGKKVGDDSERSVKIIAGSVSGAVALIAIAVAVRCFCRCSKKPGAIQGFESALGAARAARGRQDAGVGRKASTSRRRDRRH
jgi:hypothetical protein